MVVFPNAKINIGLKITGRRADGYHEISTVMVPVPWCDILEIVPSQGDEIVLSISGRPINCKPGQNIVMKAYEMLDRTIQLPPVEIYLHKVIPDGAGLGGGSADASFALTAINRLFSLGLKKIELATVAAKIGADCPMFVYNIPMLATGTGTTLAPVEMPQLKGKWIVIVKPDFSISTAEAYANVVPRPEVTPLKELVKLPVEQWKDNITNDFEESLREKYPQLEHIKRSLYDDGALYASLSGSGSALYGIFDNDKMAEAAANKFDSYETFTAQL